MALEFLFIKELDKPKERRITMKKIMPLIALYLIIIVGIIAVTTRLEKLEQKNSTVQPVLNN